jgi:N-glycosylase/DNA lyase
MKSLYLTGDQLPFNLDLTLSCGQVFRWFREGDWWNGVINQKLVSICQDGDILTYTGWSESEIIQYFNLHLSLPGIISSIRRSITTYSGLACDPFFEYAITAGQGLRIVKQDPWETLISFICSQNSNIPAITRRINLLCERYGSPIGDNKFGFPTPEALAHLDCNLLRECSTGYRAPYISRTAAMVLQQPDMLTRLQDLSISDARKKLIELPGVGPKVADCILLFGYNQMEIVPVDVWIRSIITSAYFQSSLQTPSKNTWSYDDISNFCREYYGPYAGYAQQLLFAARKDLPAPSLPATPGG